MPLLSLVILIETARVRYVLYVCLFAASLFTGVGVGTRQGWAGGQVRSESAYSTPPEPAPCPSELNVNSSVSCSSSEKYTATLQTDFTYGLVRDLVYRSISTQQVATNLYMESTPANPTTSPVLVRTDFVDQTPVEQVVIQKSYALWAQGNRADGRAVYAAQSFLVLALLFLLFAWVSILASLSFLPVSPSQNSSSSPSPATPGTLSGTLKLGRGAVVAAALCILLTVMTWAWGVSPQALSHMCVQAGESHLLPVLRSQSRHSSPGVPSSPLSPPRVTAPFQGLPSSSFTALASQPPTPWPLTKPSTTPVTCWQLANDPCSAFDSLHPPPSSCITRPPSVSLHGGLWSLMLFVALLLVLTGRVWKELEGMVGRIVEWEGTGRGGREGEGESLQAPLLSPGVKEEEAIASVA